MSMADGFRVAVVDDEDDLRDAVVEYMTMNGFAAEGFRRALDFRERVASTAFDMVILDIAMPGEDGLSLARWLRSRGRVGIIFATAAGAPIDRVVGLEIGADDYVVKPYDLRELLARVRSLARRLPGRHAETPAEPAAAPRPQGRSIRFGGLTLDLDASSLSGADGRAVDLTAKEFELLALLATRPGRPMSRSQILDLAHGEEGGDTERAVDIRITRLRKKVEPQPDTPRYIKTVRGVGYVFVGD